MVEIPRPGEYFMRNSPRGGETRVRGARASFALMRKRYSVANQRAERGMKSVLFMAAYN